jgi:hypothetical protein
MGKPVWIAGGKKSGHRATGKFARTSQVMQRMHRNS